MTVVEVVEKQEQKKTISKLETIKKVLTIIINKKDKMKEALCLNHNNSKQLDSKELKILIVCRCIVKPTTIVVLLIRVVAVGTQEAAK